MFQCTVSLRAVKLQCYVSGHLEYIVTDNAVDVGFYSRWFYSLLYNYVQSQFLFPVCLD
jgi:hypothetical protein